MAYSKVKENTIKKWITEIDTKREWVEYDTVKRNGDLFVTKLWCSICRQYSVQLRCFRNYNAAYVEGVTDAHLKKDNVSKHAKTDMHLRAIKLHTNKSFEELAATPIASAFKASEDVEKKRVKKLFDIAYTVAKNEMPFSAYETIANLEKRHEVDLGNTYLTEKKCAEFIQYIADDFTNHVQKELCSSNYFSILIDGATDVSNNEKEVIFVKYITNGVTSTRFYRLPDVQSATADGLHQLVHSAFDETLDLDTHYVGLLADGANVNLGRKKGLAGRLKEEYPWAVAIHCFNHRLELATKDCFKQSNLEVVTDMLDSIYLFYDKSPKRCRELESLAEIMLEKVSKPLRATGTRWAQHKNKAAQALLKGYTVIVAHLENQQNDHANVPPADRARIRGYLKTLNSLKFVLNLLYFVELVDPIAKLSLSLQKESVDLLQATSYLEHFYSKVGGVRHEQELASLLAGESMSFRGIDLKGPGPKESIVRAFKANEKSIADKLIGCVKNRFADMHKQDCFKGLQILDINSWPKDPIALQTHAELAMDTCISHFKLLLENNQVDIQAIWREFGEFKVFWNRNMTGLTHEEVWKCVCTMYRENYPNLVHVVEILMVFPVSNATVERSFSTMARVKTDNRNRLTEKTLENLIRIAIDGPEEQLYDPSVALECYFDSKNRRPTVQPYGPNPKKQKTDE